MAAQTLSVSAFLSTLGVNAHAGNANGAYANSSMVISALNYLGINTVRDRFSDQGTSGAAVGAMAAAGIKFDFVVSSDMPAKGDAGLTSYIAGLKAFQNRYAGSIVAIEGLNEVNIQSFTYKGSSDLKAAAAYQKALYGAVKGDTALANISVINLSVGLESTSAYAAIGDLGAYSDYGNAHAYTATGWQSDKVMEESMARAAGAAKGDPIVVTETGYTTLASDTGLGVNESAQAKLTLNAVLHAFENGSSKTFLYELFDSSLDPSGPAREFSFGLFKTDGTPKQSAVALHNLTSILSYTDAGTGTAASAASAYKLNGMPTDGHSLALTKGNGAYDLLLWRDVKMWDSATQSETTTAPRSMTIDLGGVQKTVYVYDPLNGTTPIATYTNVSSITVAMGDRPLIVEVGAKGAYTEVKPSVTPDLTLSADALVAQIDKLAVSTGLNSITLTGSTVLNVASNATMQYMVANYGSVLSKIKGSYSFLVTETGDNWKEERRFDASGKAMSTIDYGYVGGVLNNTHAEYADGTVTDQVFKAGKLAHSVTTAPGGLRTTINYDTTTGNPTDKAEESRKATILSQYKDGVLVNRTTNNADKSREIDTYDSTGKQTTMVRVDTAGVWTTTNFDSAGKVTRVFVDRPDGSGENIAYGIAGQAWTTVRQVKATNGKITLVERTRADGSYVNTERFTSDGSNIVTTFDGKGVKQQEVTVTAQGNRTTLNFNTATGDIASRIEQTSAGTTTTTYVSGTTTERTLARADGSRQTDSFSGGMLVRRVEVAVDKTFTTRLYDAVTGKPTKIYISYPDGSSANTSFGITGQSYVTEAQTVSKAGKVVSLVRTHADGSYDFTDVTSSDGTRTLSTYNAAGQLTNVTTIAADGTRTSKAFTPTSTASNTQLSELVQVNKPAASTDAQPAGTSQPGSANIIETYDANGARKSQTATDAAGNKTTTTYDAASGAVTAVYLSNANGSGETRLYGITGKGWTAEVQVTDTAGKLIALTRTRADGSAVYSERRDANGLVATVYDSNGAKQVETMTSIDGGQTILSYASDGSLTQRVIKPAAGGSTTATLSAGIITSMLTIATDGSRTATKYDAKGVKVSDQMVDSANTWTTTLYDASGTVTRRYVKRVDGTGDNYSYGITGQSYVSEHQAVDAQGKVIGLDRRNADGSLAYVDRRLDDGKRQLITFDSTGRLTQDILIGTDGGEIVKDYDAASGQLKRQLERPASGDVIVSQYDQGNLASRRSQLATGNIKLETFNADGSWSADTLNSAGSKILSQNRDAAGVWRTTMIDPATGKPTMLFVEQADGSSENTAYNVTGQNYTTQVQKLDKSGKILAVTRTGADGSLRYTEQRRADGGSDLAYYDGKGRKTADVSVSASGARETRNYDAASGALLNLVVEQTEGVTATSYAGGKVSRIEFTGSDGAKRLREYNASGTLVSDVTKTKVGEWTTLKYDAGGTLTSKYVTHADGTGENVQYNASGQPYAEQHQMVDAKGNVTAMSRYRSDGTLSFTSQTGADGRTELYRDAQGRATTQLQVRTNGDRIETQLDAATGTPLSATAKLADGTSVVSTYTGGVLVRRVTQPAGGSATTETFSASGHDTTRVAAQPGFGVMVSDSKGWISGGATDDILLADRRDMVLTGGSGSDRFLVTLGASATIRDFGAGHDLLDLSAFAKSGYQPMISLEGGNTLLRYAGGESVTLVGVTPDKLNTNQAASGLFQFG
ncbi:hypothetical protein QE363_002536 [Sphingomonas sp. SORGH_AS870]|uniref:hypothetical protein n=1 Tax=Sphingomonas sp. SORGH_AS_0870 TaxID=3041801 RepID=UPI0028631DFF|nr:hypothetical protein [Sphingomonas sp. SORGH_AS_0870]MDR6146743.1 hypothetical protein [Sphingomonas sp. SORGH_AS_0870]